MYRQSEFTKWRRCRRAHAWQYTHDLVPAPFVGGKLRPPGKHDEGTMAHCGFEVLHNGGETAEAVAAARAWFEFVPERQNDKEWEQAFQYGRSCILNYNDWLEEGQDAGVKTLGVEHEWTAPLPGGRTVFGKLDLAIDDPLRNGVVVVDMKTVGGTPKLPEEVDFQLRTYAWAWWKNTGVVPSMSQHRIVKRVLYGGTAKPPFVITRNIHVNRAILEQHEEHMVAMAEEIDRARALPLDSGFLYPNPIAGSCNWDCPFREMCPMVDDGDDWESVVQLQYVRSEDVRE